MPVYDFRCKQCATEFSLSYKSVSEYSAATPHCPQCHSTALSRLIQHVALHSGAHDYRRMSSSEMLSVLESGNKQQVDEMYRQVGASANPASALPAHEQVKSALPDKPKKKRPSRKPEA